MVAGAGGEFAGVLLLRLYVLLQSALVMRPQIMQLAIDVPEEAGEVLYFEAGCASNLGLCISLLLLFGVFLALFDSGVLVLSNLGLFRGSSLGKGRWWIELQPLEISLRY